MLSRRSPCATVCSTSVVEPSPAGMKAPPLVDDHARLPIVLKHGQGRLGDVRIAAGGFEHGHPPMLMPGRLPAMLPTLPICRHYLFGDLVSHEQRAPYVDQAQVLVVQHAQPEADLGADGVQVRVVGLFSDGKLRETHGQHAVSRPHTKRMSGASGGDNLDDTDVEQHRRRSPARTSGRAASRGPPAWGRRPRCRRCCPRARRSAASISTSRSRVSCGGPLRRSASPRFPSPPAACAVMVRVNVSGLYWNTMTPASGLNGSSPMTAPFCRRGELGKLSHYSLVRNHRSHRCPSDSQQI